MSALVLRAGRRSFRVERRTLWLSAILLGTILALGFVGLCYGGATWASPGEVLAALTGAADSVVIVEWRLPRVVAAMVFGCALGAAGAIFQTLTRNPLGSPDVIGLDAGAYTGALFAFTVLAGTSGQLAVSSVLGGLLVAALIYLLSLSNGLSGLRLVVIGIAVNAMLQALNSWIVLRADLEVAMAAGAWNAGSLNGVDWADLVLPLPILAGLLATLLVWFRPIQQSTLGDAVAATTGVGLDRLRLMMVLIGVGCTATVTAVAGPIAFIALAAPQIGRRLARTPGVALLPAALTGAVLLLTADLLAQMLLSPESLPVGVVTTAIGGCYLIWLLTQEVRRR
ncbi:iron complex transport system permease protein [Tamaricihabitans halophyticus]|uniref:Iron complex transport system permease protein n=1 Tax=Tamaricihabitans halophyticus TaxID=1262583 RepID=A0A4R2QAI7_9PSEU|nr:iron chelate uptake ABC transporter family permease subunit [Tamaricihabitans halophyticus]TCP45108.1 iron complex transport system permease protein [Tamaricihabitans halophyticus]